MNSCCEGEENIPSCVDKLFSHAGNDCGPSPALFQDRQYLQPKMISDTIKKLEARLNSADSVSEDA
ncbi:MAG: hypothetical protein CMO80_14900 [Verrucomicrobiales bacterium]|nr:hypothetical protein [Verrucomicrobiales bacterium]